LITKEACCIQFPKFPDRGYAYRRDGKYFAVAERVDGKEYLGIYDARSWTLLEVGVALPLPLPSPQLASMKVTPHRLANRTAHHHHPLQRSALETTDLAGLAWSPDGSFLAVWEGLMKVRLHPEFAVPSVHY
jgi:hypothetical protein